MNSQAFEKYIRENPDKIAKAIKYTTSNKAATKLSEEEKAVIEWAKKRPYTAKSIVMKYLTTKQKIRLRMEGLFS